MTRHPLLLVARQELVLAVRSRWTQIFAIVFAALALAVAASGYVLSGGHGVQDFARTAASLVQLVLLLVPLTSLLIGVLSLAPERGRGRAALLATDLAAHDPAGQAARLVRSPGGRPGAGLRGRRRRDLLAVGERGRRRVRDALRRGDGSHGHLPRSRRSAGRHCDRPPQNARPRPRSRRLVRGRRPLRRRGPWPRVAPALGSGLARADRRRAAEPVDAVRTAVLLGIEGAAAFGAASLAFLRFTKGPWGAAAMLSVSVLFWLAAPTLAAIRRLRRTDV